MQVKLSAILMSGILLLVSAAAVPAYAGPKSWEPVKTERADIKTVVKETDIEIKASQGLIVVACNHPVQIKIFTILGRLVNNETIPAGRSQLLLPAHGVYIVKIGDLTCKVAV